jgi:hypothetical protein
MAAAPARLAVFDAALEPVLRARRPQIVAAWLRRAGSVIENLWPDRAHDRVHAVPLTWRARRRVRAGVVPIGEPYPHEGSADRRHEVAPGETGEPLMTGPRLARLLAGRGAHGRRARYARPGATRSSQDGRPRAPAARARAAGHLGRMDSQIKIQGYRVELGEIEAALRDEAKVELAVALGWPATPSGADGVVAFVASELEDADAVLTRLKQRLPPYMVPSAIRTVSSFPLNANGKIDRKALAATLAAGPDA